MIAGTRVGTIQEILATRAKISFPYRVNFNNITFDQINEMSEWCTKHCKEIWREEHFFALYFQFTDERDAIMFMLKFGGSRGVS